MKNDKKLSGYLELQRDRYLYENRYRQEILDDMRSAFMEGYGVRPARSGRTNLHLLDRRDRARADLDPTHPLRDELDHDDLWESVETGEVVGLTFQPYFNVEEEPAARAEWAERLRPLSTNYGLVVRVRSSTFGWHVLGQTLLIEIWRPEAA